MTEQKNTTSTQTESPVKEQASNPIFQLAFFVLAIIALIVFAYNNPRAARAILLVALGFGGVVMIHELGHFLIAKLGGIKVEAFSVGFPPVAVGIRKLKKGFRVRLLPRPGQEQKVQEGDNETEYQIGLIPLGGFVKMMGQSDTGSVEQTEDPRSFLNRPIWIRIAVVAAGVTFNAIAAMLLFMGLFLHGIDLKPAVVGEVMPNSPAQEAGLRPGDEIVEVNGNRFVDYEAVLMAPVLSGKGQAISFVVRREGGREETIQVIPEISPSIGGPLAGLQSVGISPAHKLTIEPMLAREPDLMEEVYEKSGLRPNDEIKAVNNQPVSTPWELRQRIRESIAPEITLTVSRSWPEGSPRTQETLTFQTRTDPMVGNFREAFDLAHVFGMRPCLKVAQVSQPPAAMGLLQRLLGRGAKSAEQDDEAVEQLEAGDILIRIGQTPYPDFEQVRQITTEFKGRDLTLTVLRADDDGTLQPIEIVVRPYEVPGSNRVTIGFAPELAMEVSIVARTLEGGLPGAAMQLPVGATVTAVDGEPVGSFYDIARLLGANRGQRVSIEYIADGQAGGTGMVVPQRGGLHVQSALANFIPYEDLTVTFKTDNPIEAMSMGIKKVKQFVVRTLITLYRLIFDKLPTSSLMGPVGIITVSYSIADASLIHYLYFLGLLSSILAVMNLLPLPVLDGGVIVMLTIEKIIGRPISEKVQATITYIGLALLLALMLLVTYNDIIRMLFGAG